MSERVVLVGAQYVEPPTLSMRQMHRVIRSSLENHLARTGSEAVEKIVFELRPSISDRDKIERTRSELRGRVLLVTLWVTLADPSRSLENGRWLLTEMSSAVANALARRVGEFEREAFEAMFAEAAEALPGFIEPLPESFEFGPGSTW